MVGVFICLSINFKSGYAADSAEILRIGFIGPLSGNAAILGVDTVPALQIAIAEENKKGDIRIELFVEDDQYVTSKAISAYERLVRVEKVDVLIVLTYGAMFALEQRVQKDGVLVIDTLDCDEHLAKLPDNFFCITKTTEDLGRVTAEVAFERDDHPAGFIYYEGDPFMGILSRASKERLEELGAEVAMFEGYAPGTNDFKSLLLKAKGRKVRSLFFYGYDELGGALQQARSLGLEPQFYSWNCVSSPGFRASSRGAEEGMIISTYLAPKTENKNIFLESFRQHTKGRQPSFEVSLFPAYDSIKILAAGYRGYLKSKHSSSMLGFLKDFLLSINNYQGISGVITIDSDGATRSIKTAPYQLLENELREYRP